MTCAIGLRRGGAVSRADFVSSQRRLVRRTRLVAATADAAWTLRLAWRRDDGRPVARGERSDGRARREHDDTSAADPARLAVARGRPRPETLPPHEPDRGIVRARD